LSNLSGDPAQDYFSDGMTGDIIAELSRFRSLFVVARHSSFAYRGKTTEIKRVGRELGVRYVAEGSVRKIGNRVRVKVVGPGVRQTSRLRLGHRQAEGRARCPGCP